MLNSMSLYYQKQNFDVFLEKHNEDKELIFDEINSLLGNQVFSTKKCFINALTKLFSSDGNKKRKLKSGLILKMDEDMPILHLTDKNNTFKIDIEFLKKIQILDKEKGNLEEKYIISQGYYSYILLTLKKGKIKYKFKDCDECSFFSKDFEDDIVYNKNFEYISVNPDLSEIYDDIYNVLNKEKKFTTIEAKDLFNKYRLLNFPEINGVSIDKIKFKPVHLSGYDFRYKYLVYNKRIGLTLLNQKLLIRAFQDNRKFFYCNMEFLYNELDLNKIRNYLLFYLAFLFSIEEKDKYINFIDNNIISLIYVYKGKTLVNKLLDLLFEQFDDTFKFFIDNVKSDDQLKIVQNLLCKYTKEEIIIFIQINERTLLSLFDMHYYKLIEIIYDDDLINDYFEYYIPICLKEMSETDIKDKYRARLKTFFEKLNYDSYLYLLKVKYILSENDINLHKLLAINSFLDYIYIKIYNGRVYDAKWRNNTIKEIFGEFYINYVSKFKNINNNIFHDITKSEEGINFERQIIFDLILKNNNINKIKVDRIYSIQEFPDMDIERNKEYFFIQDKSNAPYYDFLFLYYSNDSTIINAGQIGINKNDEQLSHLNNEFLLFDLFYFAQKMKFEKKIKIDKIQISLITTYNAFEENQEYLNNNIPKNERKYNNFTTMKQFCDKNKYIFLIFDTRNTQFYRFNKENQLKKTDLKYNARQFDIKKIFKKSKYIENTIKMCYYFKPKDPSIIAKIKLPKEFDNKRLNGDFNFKIIGRYAIYEQICRKDINCIKEGNKRDIKDDIYNEKISKDIKNEKVLKNKDDNQKKEIHIKKEKNEPSSKNKDQKTSKKRYRDPDNKIDENEFQKKIKKFN